MRGNCYTTCEALYHLLGGKDAGWKPINMRHEGDSHWFLKHKSGLILDPTTWQFEHEPDHSQAVGRGFQTKNPSERAVRMISIMLWGE